MKPLYRICEEEMSGPGDTLGMGNPMAPAAPDGVSIGSGDLLDIPTAKARKEKARKRKRQPIKGS